MSLRESTINNLKEIIREEYGRVVTFEEAENIANTLVSYYDALARIYHETKKEIHESNVES